MILALFLALFQIGMAATTVQGRVVEWGTTTPIASVEVELRPVDNTGAASLAAVTTAQGDYRFSSVPPGRYRLIAVRAGFTQGEYRQRRAGGAGMAITVVARKPATNVTLAMAPGGAISGRLIDRDGRPVQRGNVSAMRLSYVDGRPSLTTIQSGITDDRGEYRLFWLPPGQYYVQFRAAGRGPSIMVNPNGPDTTAGMSPLVTVLPLRPGTATRPANLDEREIYLPIYYPGTSELKAATLINLRAGEEVRDVNGAAVVRSTVRIRVSVIDASTGLPPASTARVFISPAGPLSTPQGTSLSSTLKIGSTVMFDGLAPGSYEIRAGVGDTDVAGRAVVEAVDRDLDVSIPLGVFTLSGSVRIDNAPAGFDPPQHQVVLRSDPAFRPAGGISANGLFRLDDVPAGNYQVTISDAALRETFVKSIRMGPADVLTQGLRISGRPVNALEIVLSGNGGELTGSVMNDRQQALPESTVVLVPNVPASPQRFDLYKTAATDSEGKFQIRGIAPGEYSVYAWEAVDPGAWLDPNFLKLFSRFATTIRISEGQKLKANVLCIPY